MSSSYTRFEDGKIVIGNDICPKISGLFANELRSLNQCGADPLIIIRVAEALARMAMKDSEAGICVHKRVGPDYEIDLEIIERSLAVAYGREGK